MKRSSTVVLVLVGLTCTLGAQVSFECYPPGPLPADPAFGCEGVASNGFGLPQAPQPGTGVTTTPSCGFPTNGLTFLIIAGNGPGFQPPTNVSFQPPVGGPFPRPIPALVTEVRIPIPAGATSISMDWEFFNRECSSTTYYDGMSIDVVTNAGGLVQNLLYVDTLSTESTCSIGTDYCAGPMSETAPAGPNALALALPPLGGCEYVSIAVWNGNDNAFSSIAYIDNVQFTQGGSPCPVPCFVVSPGPPTLAFSSPSGSGCVQVNLGNLPGGGFYFLAATLQAGAFPNGWFFGVDISFPELQAEINTGFPFIGGVTGSACGSVGGATIGEFCGVPSGLTFYAVAVGAPFGSSYPTAVTNAASYTIP